MAYLLDTNVFIQAWNLGYKWDRCSEFWHWLVQKNEENIIYSIKEVLNEIKRKDDELARWVEGINGNFFIEVNSNVESKLKDIDNWIKAQNYAGAAVDALKKGAGSFLVAHALSVQDGFKVVTLEKRSNSKSKIPNVCDSFNIDCIMTDEMLRRERAPFFP